MANTPERTLFDSVFCVYGGVGLKLGDDWYAGGGRSAIDNNVHTSEMKTRVSDYENLLNHVSQES